MVQQSKWMESNTKFDVANPKARQIFTEDAFFKWSSKNFYRTSTNDMTTKVTPPRFNCFLIFFGLHLSFWLTVIFFLTDPRR